MSEISFDDARRFTAALNYKAVLESLTVYDDEQLKELFIDLNDPTLAERIANVAYAFVEAWADKEIEKHELSQDEDALQIDNARRVREAK